MTDSKKKNSALEKLTPALKNKDASVGCYLQEKRLEKKIELSDVSKALNIKEEFLKKIETEDFSDLPGLSFAVGFVKSYAIYIGIKDPESVARRFKLRMSSQTHKTDPLKPEIPETKTSFSSVKKASLLIVILIGFLALYGWYYQKKDASSAPLHSEPKTSEDTFEESPFINENDFPDEPTSLLSSDLINQIHANVPENSNNMEE